MPKLLKTSRLPEYLLRFGVREHPALARCREEAVLARPAPLDVRPEQASLVQLMARAINARRAVAVGVASGYASTALALALREMHGAGGLLVACELSANRLDLAADYWVAAGVNEVVQPQLGRPADTLHALLSAGETGTFDFALIDTDEPDYDLYYELCLRLLRPGGALMIDDMLSGGSVVDHGDHSPHTRAARVLAAKVHGDERVDMSLIPVSGGLLMALKR